MLRRIDIPRQARRNVGMGRYTLSLDNFFGHDFTVDGMAHCPANAHIVKGRMTDLRGEIPGDRGIVHNQFFTQLGIALQPSYICRRHCDEIQMAMTTRSRCMTRLNRSPSRFIQPYLRRSKA